MNVLKLLFLATISCCLINCTIKPQQAANTPAATRVILEENYEGFCHIDGKVDNTYKGYNASGYAQVDQTENARIEWKVNVAKAGLYTLAWRYAAEGNAITARVSGNKNHSSVNFSATGAWDKWADTSVSLPLSTGINTITLSATSNSGLPHIDSLTVSGTAVSAVNCDGSPVALYQPNPRCVAGTTFTDEVVDCGGARVGLSCEGGEFQPPVITLENATVKNLRIAADGGSDGIWCSKGDCTLENIVWEDICEDAATQKSTPGSTMTVIGGWAWNNGGGKIFQHNAPDTTVIVTGGFTAKGKSAKLLRACGNCVGNGGGKKLIIDGVRVEGTLLEEVVAPNANYGDIAKVRNLSIKDYQPGKPDICSEWNGFEKSEKKPSQRLGEAWNTTSCDVDPSHVTGF